MITRTIIGSQPDVAAAYDLIAQALAEEKERQAEQARREQDDTRRRWQECHREFLETIPSPLFSFLGLLAHDGEFDEGFYNPNLDAASLRITYLDHFTLRIEPYKPRRSYGAACGDDAPRWSVVFYDPIKHTNVDARTLPAALGRAFKVVESKVEEARQDIRHRLREVNSRLEEENDWGFDSRLDAAIETATNFHLLQEFQVEFDQYRVRVDDLRAARKEAKLEEARRNIRADLATVKESLAQGYLIGLREYLDNASHTAIRNDLFDEFEAEVADLQAQYDAALAAEKAEKERQEERRRGEREARFFPFVYYTVRYAYIATDEYEEYRDIATDHFDSLTPEPDEDGFWTARKRFGECSRARYNHVFKVERIEVTEADEMPAWCPQAETEYGMIRVPPDDAERL